MARTLEHKIPPPAVTLGIGALMWLLSRVTAARWTELPGQRIVAVLAIVAGVAMLILGIMEFRRSRTTFNPMTPEAASALVGTGIFGLTRNPMYLGLLMFLLAWALFLSNGLALLGLPAFILYMNRFQIAPEERALAALFGAEFAAYKARVRRWL